MRKLIILTSIFLLLGFSVKATDMTAPEVPRSGEQYMPEDTESFSEGLWYIIKTAISKLRPELSTAAQVCCSLLALGMAESVMSNLSDKSNGVVHLCINLAVGMILITPANTLIQLGIKTVEEISEYGKLLLPVMTAGMAAQGGVTASVALYTATAMFNTVLSTLLTSCIIPLIYVYIALAIASSTIQNPLLENISKFVKWVMTWGLKIVLYLFTGYISITGVVSGTTDAAAVKAAKLAISGAVPVVGSILSDASETILVSAGIMKNAAGIYGLLAILAILIGPFLRIGIQYLMLKFTTAVNSVFSQKETVGLIQKFADVMGLLLGMTGTVSLLLLVSTVCFMKGIG